MLLQSFLAVANSQSFSSAAHRLNITQSTVSHQIARLEDHLGKQLFERTTRSCRLTAEGRELVEFATRVIRIVDEMEQCFRPSLLRGTVVIGVSDDYHLFLPLTQAFKGFMESKPGVAIEVRAGLSADLQRDLNERKIDLAVLRKVPAASPAESLITDNLVWITSEYWTPPRDGVIPLALVAGACNYRRTAIAALDERRLPWKCIVSCTSLEGVLAVVQAGMAVSVVTEGDVRGGVIAAPSDGLLPQLPRSSLTIRFAEGEPSLVARALARTIANVLKQKHGDVER
ncbi:LysR family transcriptional regulator [Microvirga sp. VF16]|uniref:LysR family transcriptional regulator n=1 Tax=Microvirga sp. VF16 TaxID=2807101 RepID=UPI001FEE435F|nr:LysR family transcriptional regulator [Microvirga sp. VF16]